MSEKRKIVLDVDTGSDDAVAIIAAALSKDIDLLAVCSVAGNQPLVNTTENSLRVVQMLGMDIPVYKGVQGPMAAHLNPYRQRVKKIAPALDDNGNPIRVHEEYLKLPEAKNKIEDISAPFYYINLLKNTKEKITIVPVGPLTNLAIALLIEPSIVDNIEEIVIMGGGHLVRNSTSASEFNIWYDPEAAQIVMTCGAKITLVPLDCTHEATLSLANAEEYKKYGKPGEFVAEMIEKRCAAYRGSQPMATDDVVAVHDAVCICYLLNPAVLKDVRHMRVDVDTSGGFGDGQTVCDTRTLNVLPKNAYVALDGDAELFGRIIGDILKEAMEG